MARREIQYEGVLDLAGISIPCYVLDDGTRVLSGRKMQEALKIVDSDDGKQTAGTRLNRYLEQKTLEPFIYKGREPDHFKPIVCYRGTQKVNGYEATMLADLCDAFLEARKHIQLSPRQAIIAEQCEILIRAFAKVGITALVDEATGYQYEREKDELQHILKKYISEELLPWQKRFPDIFYKELFRLNGWDYTVRGIKKRPGVIGTWTKKLVYEQLPNGVLEELQQNVPRTETGVPTARFHQLLTDDIGSPHLTAQINQIVTLFQLSDNMQEMWNNFQKLKMRQSGQMELPFAFDEKGHTKE
jgi:phage protein|nr:MAG TPA: P63C domain protein [Caudoviricetes sp.]